VEVPVQIEVEQTSSVTTTITQTNDPN